MPALFVFLMKVNLALLLFCAGYYLVLRHLTFYTLNRFYLVGAIIFASVYPLINLSAFVGRHRQLAPVQNAMINWNSQDIIKPITQPAYWYWIELMFWLGVILLAVRLLMQLISLYKLYKNSTPTQLHNHDVRVITNDAGPFSFWKSIYVNPANHKPEDLKAILLHEQIHVNEWHTLDVLLAELSTISYWFNPGVWLMKRAVRENIEFITDRKILNRGMDTKQYQYSLVSVTFASSSNTLVNNFNISTIKKRIIMMNAKRSSKFKLTRYAFLVPAVIMLLLVFTISKAAIEKTTKAPAVGHLTLAVKKSLSIKLSQPTVSKILAVIKKQKLADTTKKELQTILVSGDSTKHLTLSLDTDIKVTGKGSKSKRFNNLDAVYIIDGVPGKVDDLSSVNPNQIQSIDIKKENDKSVVYVTTYKGAKPSNVHVTGFTTSYNYDTIKDGAHITAIRINGVSDTVHFKNMARVNFKNENFKVTKDNMLYVSPSTSSVSINDLADKMVVIDGKTATEADLRKLSAFDIGRMVYKNDHETKELYGENAKNGVIFILTKKSLNKGKAPKAF
jgi:bla regulator protein BlaR1